MSDFLQEVHGQIKRRYIARPDGTHAEFLASMLVDADGSPINLSQGGDRELLVSRFVVRQAFTGAEVGHVVLKSSVLDVSGGSVEIIGVTWENESTGLAIAAPTPLSEYIEPLKTGDPLTLAQLLSAGLATAANQVTHIGYAQDLIDAVERTNVGAAISDPANWSDFAVAPVYTSLWRALVAGTGFAAGETLNRVTTLEHATESTTVAWRNGSTDIAAPIADAVSQASAEIITSHSRRRTSPLSPIEQTRTVTYLMAARPVPHTDTGWG